jgi:hypothetical protein
METKTVFQEWRKNKQNKHREKMANINTAKVMFGKGFRPVTNKQEGDIKVGNVYYRYDESLGGSKLDLATIKEELENCKVFTSICV